MTALDWWDDLARARRSFRVNDCLYAHIGEAETRSTDDIVTLTTSRVAPLIWLAMPGHDTPDQRRQEASDG
jgi:hypothetical protein